MALFLPVLQGALIRPSWIRLGVLLRDAFSMGRSGVGITLAKQRMEAVSSSLSQCSLQIY